MTITATSIDLSWSAPVGGGAVDAYVVLYRATGSGAFAVLAEVVGITSYSVTGLVPTTSYDFMVYARNGAGPGQACVVTQATLGMVPNVPVSPYSIAGPPAYSTIFLEWTWGATDSTHGPATGSIVRYRVTGSGSWTTITYASGIEQYQLTGLAHDTSYDMEVAATNSAGASPFTATVTRTTDYAPPNAPSAPTVGPAPDGTTSKLTVAWSAPATDSTHDAATGYDLRYSVHNAGSWIEISNVSSGAIITGLSAATSYDVQVRAKNASTESPGAWSGSGTGSTYGVAVTWGDWTASSTQTAGTSVAPNGGVNFYAVPAPTTPSGEYLAWSVSNTVVPASGLITAAYAGATNKYGAYFNAPASAGTYYLWAFSTDGGGNPVGALVSSAITVT